MGIDIRVAVGFSDRLGSEATAPDAGRIVEGGEAIPRSYHRYIAPPVTVRAAHKIAAERVMPGASCFRTGFVE